MKNRLCCVERMSFIVGCVLLAAAGCGDDSSDSASASVGGTSSGSAGMSAAGGSAGTSAAGGSSGAVATGGSSGAASVSIDCSTGTTDTEATVCAAQAFLSSLSATELAAVQLEFTASADRTKWSNLPGVARAGAKMSALSTEARASAIAFMHSVLSEAGASDLDGVMAADDYLGTLSSGMGGPGGMGAGQYSSDNYYVAIFGTPSTSASWGIAFGGHHMAFNIAFVTGTGYPIPNHIGVEPKSSFTINGRSYEPLSDEGNAMLAAFEGLSEAELASAYLSGQTFADVLIGPVEYGTGSEAAVTAKYPSGVNRTGVLVSSLTDAQKALVTVAIEEWVGDYRPAIADALLADYTSQTAFADTLIAWGGTEASGVDPDVNGTYMRIDGPRVWIELSCQAGVVVQNVTHYHTIFRDKQFDYAGTL
jgi:hypothetical protein